MMKYERLPYNTPLDVTRASKRITYLQSKYAHARVLDTGGTHALMGHFFFFGWYSWVNRVNSLT